MEIALKILQEIGLDIEAVQFVARWKGFDVYGPDFGDGEPPAIGLPQFVLVKGNEGRMADYNESFEILDSLPE